MPLVCLSTLSQPVQLNGTLSCSYTSSHFWLYSKSLLRFSTSNTFFIVRVARLFKLRRLAPLVPNTVRPGIIVQQPHTPNMVPLRQDSNNSNVWESSRKHRHSNYNNRIYKVQRLVSICAFQQSQYRDHKSHFDRGAQDSWAGSTNLLLHKTECN